MKDSSQPSPGRRDFMKAAIFGIGGLISAAIGLPALAYIVGPALKQAASEWIRLGLVSNTTSGTEGPDIIDSLETSGIFETMLTGSP